MASIRRLHTDFQDKPEISVATAQVASTSTSRRSPQPPSAHVAICASDGKAGGVAKVVKMDPGQKTATSSLRIPENRQARSNSSSRSKRTVHGNTRLLFSPDAGTSHGADLRVLDRSLGSSSSQRQTAPSHPEEKSLKYNAQPDTSALGLSIGSPAPRGPPSREIGSPSPGVAGHSIAASPVKHNSPLEAPAFPPRVPVQHTMLQVPTDPVTHSSGHIHMSHPDRPMEDIQEVGDRVSFEVPSGAHGRLRVSLAWFRDRRRRSRPGSTSHSEVPPSLPSKSPSPMKPFSAEKPQARTGQALYSPQSASLSLSHRNPSNRTPHTPMNPRYPTAALSPYFPAPPNPNAQGRSPVQPYPVYTNSAPFAYPQPWMKPGGALVRIIKKQLRNNKRLKVWILLRILHPLLLVIWDTYRCPRRWALEWAVLSWET